MSQDGITFSCRWTDLRTDAAPEGSTSTVSLLALDDPSAIPLGILKRIVEKLLIDDLTRLMMTSSRLRRLAQEVLQDRVQDLLTSYRIPLHLNFLDFMRQHDLIITGHAVVRFLLGMEAKVAKVGLNILVAGDNEDLVINYLEQIDYFPILAPHVNVALNMYALSGLSRITRLASFNHDTGTFSRINILSISPSVDRNRAVAFQPTTASMSYITADTINVLFPHMTFKRQALIAINHLQPPPSHLHYNISDSLDTLSDYAALHVQKLLADGIDVRYSTVVPNFHWLRDGCHFGCASTFNRHGGGTLVAPFSEAAVSERSRHLDDLMAAHVKLLLGGLCQNVRCPTHVDR